MASRLLTDTVPELQTKVPLIISDYETAYPGRELKVICTLRSTEEQQALFDEGRTKVDGVHKFSKHNPDPTEPLAKAVDFGVFVNNQYITQNSYYYPLLDLARKYQLISGLDFFDTGQPLEQCLAHPYFKDPPHVEIPGKLYVPPQV